MRPCLAVNDEVVDDDVALVENDLAVLLAIGRSAEENMLR